MNRTSLSCPRFWSQFNMNLFFAAEQMNHHLYLIAIQPYGSAGYQIEIVFPSPALDNRWTK